MKDSNNYKKAFSVPDTDGLAMLFTVMFAIISDQKVGADFSSTASGRDHKNQIEIISRYGFTSLQIIQMVQTAYSCYKNKDLSCAAENEIIQKRDIPKLPELFQELYHSVEDPIGFVQEYTFGYISERDLEIIFEKPYEMICSQRRGRILKRSLDDTDGDIELAKKQSSRKPGDSDSIPVTQITTSKARKSSALDSCRENIVSNRAVIGKMMIIGAIVGFSVAVAVYGKQIRKAHLNYNHIKKTYLRDCNYVVKCSSEIVQSILFDNYLTSGSADAGNALMDPILQTRFQILISTLFDEHLGQFTGPESNVKTLLEDSCEVQQSAGLYGVDERDKCAELEDKLSHSLDPVYRKGGAYGKAIFTGVFLGISLLLAWVYIVIPTCGE